MNYKTKHFEFNIVFSKKQPSISFNTHERFWIVLGVWNGEPSKYGITFLSYDPIFKYFTLFDLGINKFQFNITIF